MAASRRHLNHLHESLNHTHEAKALHWHYGEFDNDDRSFQIHGQTLLYILILFSLILLVTLLLLYTRWFFRLRHLPSNPPNAGVSIPQLLVSIPPPPRSYGLHRDIVSSIPIYLHDGRIHRDLECAICLGLFEDGDKVKVLPSCGHGYHCECVDAWLKDHSNCPLCRVVIAFDWVF